MARPTKVKGLGPRTPLRKAAPLLLGARLADVRKREPALGDFTQTEPIHQMRVAIRRLRAALRLLGGDETLRTPLRQMKKLQDALGEVRDLQLQLAWLSKARAPLAVECGRKLGVHKRALARTVRVWTSRTAPALEAGLGSVVGAGRLGGKKMRRSLARELRGLGALLREALDRQDARSAHRLRIAVKKLRYHVEVVAPALDHAASAVLRTLEPLQETLGALHDLDVRLALLGAESEGDGLQALRKEQLAARAEQGAALDAELARWKAEKIPRKLRRLLSKPPG